MSTGDDSLIGQVLEGRYAISAEIGRGGHGIVYRATHVQLGREVAVKVITTPGDGLDRRFRREAQVQARLRHPAVVKLLDFGVDGDGRLYMVQEFVEGESLQDRLKQGTPTLEESALVVGDVLDALAEAHALGIVHRDIKPSNIMVVEGPRRIEARLLDFGIAKLLDHAGHTRLTRAGSLVGTPGYMAPEQVALEPLSPASDLYSAGVVLYQLLCGRRPYNGTVKAVLSAHLHGTPPPLPDYVPPAMARVAMVALARQPAERFPDADAMHAALRAAHRSAEPGGAHGAAPGADLATPPLDRRSLGGFPAGRPSLPGGPTPPGDPSRGRHSLSGGRRPSGPVHTGPASIGGRRSLGGSPSGPLPSPGPRTRIDDGADLAHLTPRLDDDPSTPGAPSGSLPPGFGAALQPAAPQDRPTAPRFQPTPSGPARRAPARLGLIAALALTLAVTTAGLTLWIARPGAARDEGPTQRVKVGSAVDPVAAHPPPAVAPPPDPPPAAVPDPPPAPDAALDPEPIPDPEPEAQPAFEPGGEPEPAPAPRATPRRRRSPRVAPRDPPPPPPAADAGPRAAPVEPVAALESLIDAAFEDCRCDDALARLDGLARLDPASARQRRSRHRQECRLALPGNCVTRAAGKAP